ncbi:MAG TPA: hypothetical protein VME69_10315, partial [Methylocella sp.]|nr:hypothetical protein [Methylocella sp.]
MRTLRPLFFAVFVSVLFSNPTLASSVTMPLTGTVQQSTLDDGLNGQGFSGPFGDLLSRCQSDDKNRHTIYAQNSTQTTGDSTSNPGTASSTNQHPKVISQTGEKALKELVGGESQIYFKTDLGGRRVDQLANGNAHEAKVGYQSLTASNRKQILKDVELKKSGQINESTW